jgi:hypothetical protein
MRSLADNLAPLHGGEAPSIEEVAPATPEEKFVQFVGRKLGVNTRFIRSTDGELGVNGHYDRSRPGDLYFNVGPESDAYSPEDTTRKSIHDLFVHEFTHDLRATKPEIWNRLEAKLEELVPGETAAGREEFLRRMFDVERKKVAAGRSTYFSRDGAPTEKGRDVAREEGVAETSEITNMRGDVLRKIATEEPGVFKDLFRSMMLAKDKLVSILTGSAARKQEVAFRESTMELERAFRSAAREAKLSLPFDAIPVPGETQLRPALDVDMASPEMKLASMSPVRPGVDQLVNASLRFKQPEGGPPDKTAMKVANEMMRGNVHTNEDVQKFLGTDDADFVKLAMKSAKEIVAQRAKQVRAYRPAELEGAPEFMQDEKGNVVPVTSQKHVDKLLQKLRDMADEGQSGRMWYENSSKQILDATQGDKGDAEKIAQLIAIYSPRNPIKNNLDDALQAWYQFKNGEPIKAGMITENDRRASELLYGGKDWSGRKTNNFYKNLMRVIDPKGIGAEFNQGTTVDVHMMRAGGFTAGAPTDNQYNWFEKQTAKLAAERGWEPQQFQAAVWTSQKFRKEILPLIASGKLPPNTAPDPTDYAKLAKSINAMVTWEAVPHPSSGVLPKLEQASYGDRKRYTKEIARAVLQHGGWADEAAKLSGLLRYQQEFGPGFYKGQSNPGVQGEFTVPQAHGHTEREGLVEPAAKESLNAYASALGYVMRQQAMAWHRPFFVKSHLSLAKANGMHYDLGGRSIAPAEVKDVYTKLVKLDPEHADMIAIVPDEKGVRLLNVGISDNKQFQSLAKKAMEQSRISATIRESHFRWDGDYIDNDWSVHKDGEGYLDRLGQAKFAPLREWAERVARPAADAINSRYADRFGPDARGGEADGGEADAVRPSLRQRPDTEGVDRYLYDGHLGELHGVGPNGERLFSERVPRENLADRVGEDHALQLNRSLQHWQTDYEEIGKRRQLEGPSSPMTDEPITGHAGHATFADREAAWEHVPLMHPSGISKVDPQTGGVRDGYPFPKRQPPLTQEQVADALSREDAKRSKAAADNVRTALRREKLKGFFSAARDAVTKMPEGMLKNGQSALNHLTKQGVKKAEISWLGLDDLLASKAGQKVDRSELLEHINRNYPDIEEVVRTTPGKDVLPGIQNRKNIDTKWQEYTGLHPNGPRGDMHEYAEIVLRLKPKGGDTGEWDKGFRDWVQDKGFSAAAMTNELRTRLASEYARIAGPRPQDNGYVNDAMKVHWPGESSVLGHARVSGRTDADGKRTLLVEELQSDWAQALKKAGVAKSEKKLAELRAKVSSLDADRMVILQQREKIGHDYSTSEASNAAAMDRRYNDISGEINRLENEIDRVRTAPPDHPFADDSDWTRLLMKKVIQHAAANGYDRIAILGGEDQANRYGLQHHVDTISYDPETKLLTGYKGGKHQFDQTVERDRLPEMIGKEPAEKILQQVESGDHIARRDAVAGRLANLREASDSVIREHDFFGHESISAAREYLLDEALIHRQNMDRYGHDRDFPSLEDRLAAREPQVPKEQLGHLAQWAGEMARDKDQSNSWEWLPHIAGEDLQVGGKGMRTYYDLKVPGVVEKLIKPLGSKMQQSTLDFRSNKWVPNEGEPPAGVPQGNHREGESRTYNAFDVTPQMRDVALNDQMPLFSLRKTAKATNREQLDQMLRKSIGFDKNYDVQWQRDGTDFLDRPTFAGKLVPEDTLWTPGGELRAETGKPLTFLYHRTTRSVTDDPMFGVPNPKNKQSLEYGRDVEPSGRYMAGGELGAASFAAPPGTPSGRKYQSDYITFRNPLVIDFGVGGPTSTHTELDYKSTTNWKRRLAAAYGATGKDLSKAIIADGYDAIVTVDRETGKLNEIVDLTTFDENKAKYSLRRTPLANPAETKSGRNFVDANDSIRDERMKDDIYTDQNAAADAEKILADPQHIEKLYRKVRGGAQLAPDETVAAKRMVADSVRDVRRLSADNISRAVDLVDGYRETGRVQAEAFRLRGTGTATADRGEQLRQWIGESLFSVPGDADRRAGRDPLKRAEARKQWASKIADVMTSLRDSGIDLPSVLANPESVDPGKLARVVREIQTAKSDTGDMVYEAWINGILSSPATHAANVLGNATNVMVEYAVNRPVETTLNLLARDPDSATFGEIRHVVKRVPHALAQAARMYLTAMRTESPSFEQSVTGGAGYDKTEIPKAIPGKIGQAVRFLGSRTLTAEDEFFKALVANMEVAAQAHRVARREGHSGDALDRRIGELIDTPGSEAWVRALDDAKRLTFQTPAGDSVKAFVKFRDATHQAVHKLPIPLLNLKYAVPFTTTIANLMGSGFRKTPLWTPMFAYQLMHHATQRATGREVSVPARTLMHGAADQILAYGTLAVVSGLLKDDKDGLPRITGSMPSMGVSRGERQLANRTVPPMSIRVGNHSISYGRWEPFATSLAATIDLMQQAEEAKRNGVDPGKVLSTAGTKMLNMVKEKSFARGIADIADAMENSKSAADFVSRYYSGFTPNSIKTFARASDDYVRDSATHGKGTALYKDLADKTKYRAFPAAGVGGVQPQVDVWGNDVRKQDFGSPAANVAFRTTSPVDVREISSESVDRMILSWNKQHPDDPYYPQTPQRLDGMDDASFHRYASETGADAIRVLRTTHLNLATPAKRDVEKVQKTLEGVRARWRKRNGFSAAHP